MNAFLLGSMSMGFFVAGLFFWTFFRTTRDLLFLLFAIAFWVECLNRAALALADSPTEGRPIFFLGRLIAYLLIIAAIVQKNFSKRG
jgi:uncharacterized membrane protein HdeD (DUF308 family)